MVRVFLHRYIFIYNFVDILLSLIGTSQVQHEAFENNELTARDTLAAYLLQIESRVKFCQNLIKESTRLDIPHKSFVEKTHVFAIELKSLSAQSLRD
jgi:hypothetical protein